IGVTGVQTCALPIYQGGKLATPLAVGPEQLAHLESNRPALESLGLGYSRRVLPGHRQGRPEYSPRYQSTPSRRSSLSDAPTDALMILPLTNGYVIQFRGASFAAGNPSQV